MKSFIVQLLLFLLLSILTTHAQAKDNFDFYQVFGSVQTQANIWNTDSQISNISIKLNDLRVTEVTFTFFSNRPTIYGKMIGACGSSILMKIKPPFDKVAEKNVFTPQSCIEANDPKIDIRLINPNKIFGLFQLSKLNDASSIRMTWDFANERGTLQKSWKCSSTIQNTKDSVFWINAGTLKMFMFKGDQQLFSDLQEISKSIISQ